MLVLLPTPTPLEQPSSIVEGKDRQGTQTDEPVGQEDGRLAFVLESMPTEVVLKVFSFCHPLALLHAARATKTLRGILLCESARWIWRSARNVEGMGWEWATPHGRFTEADWVKLLYEHTCSTCGELTTAPADCWQRRRLCPSCSKTATAIAPDDLEGRFEDKNVTYKWRFQWLLSKCANEFGWDIKTLRWCVRYCTSEFESIRDGVPYNEDEWKKVEARTKAMFGGCIEQIERGWLPPPSKEFLAFC